MARTISPHYDQRRDAIVQKAARLYAQNGFLGASISDLAKACKTSKSLIYHYYASKEDILFEVMSYHLAQLNEVIEQVAQGSYATAEEKLAALTQGFMKKYLGAAASHKVLLNELDNLPADKRRAIVEEQRLIIQVVERLLKDIRPELGEDTDLTRPLTMMYFGMINWTHTWYDPKGPVSAEQFAKLTVDLLLQGLRAIELKSYVS